MVVLAIFSAASLCFLAVTLSPASSASLAFFNLHLINPANPLPQAKIPIIAEINPISKSLNVLSSSTGGSGGSIGGRVVVVVGGIVVVVVVTGGSTGVGMVVVVGIVVVSSTGVTTPTLKVNLASTLSSGTDTLNPLLSSTAFSTSLNTIPK